MADIRAFRGFRYDLGRIGELAKVVAPPYDVIDPALQQQLYNASEYNAIRLELTRDEPGDNEQQNKYTRAASTLKDWITQDAIRQDTARSLYVYEQEYTVEGTTHIRRGFLARVRLEPFGTGRIFPHEQTLSGPKADRLSLYRATHFNISPVFGLYPDTEGEVFAKLAQAIGRTPPIEATDHLGVINRLWVVTDSSTISAVTGLMGPKPVFIADGHHRYETGLKYLEERRAMGEVADEEVSANFCLMMLVGMSDPGLLILPTHRLISGLPNITAEQLKSALGDAFEVIGEYDSAAKCWEHVEVQADQSVLGFGTPEDGKWLVALFRKPELMAEYAAEQTQDWRSLAVSILHKVVLERQLPAHFAGTTSCKYVHLLQEVTDAIAGQQCQLACLVPPVAMEHVEAIAGNREKMPPKSTYFYPKILTGLVYNSLKQS